MIQVFEHKARDRMQHEYEAPNVEGILVGLPATWGTPAWRAHQPANTARFDYVLIPQENPHHLSGRAEIRRVIAPDGAQSAASDHLPVDARIWKVLEI